MTQRGNLLFLIDRSGRVLVVEILAEPRQQFIAALLLFGIDNGIWKNQLFANGAQEDILHETER